jgi:hypothetical protein
VTAFYLSNVGLSIEGHFPMTWFRDLYTTLAKLPVASNALTLVAHGPWRLTGYVRPFKQAQWVYETLAGVPEEVVIRLHEAPLEIMTQMGNAHLLRTLREGLVRLNAPAAYQELIKDPKHLLIPGPGIDATSPLYKTLKVTLVEAGFIPQPTP